MTGNVLGQARLSASPASSRGMPSPAPGESADKKKRSRLLREGRAASAIDILNEAAMHRWEPDRLWGSHRGGIVVRGDAKGLRTVPRVETRRVASVLAGTAGCGEGFAVRPDTMARLLPPASPREATLLKRPGGGEA